MITYDGHCHCGAVRFSVDDLIVELTTCDCSLCRMRNAVMAKVPDKSLVVSQGADALELYEWNTRRANHYFCKVCGIYLFHRKRAAPDHFGVNAFTLMGLDVTSLPIRSTDGATMSVTVDDALPWWLGPRLSGG